MNVRDKLLLKEEEKEKEFDADEFGHDETEISENFQELLRTSAGLTSKRRRRKRRTC